jgi:hypothetical protein
MEGRAAEPDPPHLCLYYFIGRANPPHEGHILTLTEMLTKVKQQQTEGNYSRAMIILGSGPKKNGKIQQTSDNPITHELKEAFIRYKLTQLFGDIDIDSLCDIKMMDHPFKDVGDFVLQQMEINPISQCASIQLYQYAGNKGDDGDKLYPSLLAGRETAIKKMKDLIELQELDELLPVVIGTEAIEPTKVSLGKGAPEQSMSATQIRESVYNDMFAKREGWTDQFRPFYGTFVDDIYTEIASKTDEYHGKMVIKAERAAATRKRTFEKAQESPSPQKKKTPRTPTSPLKKGGKRKTLKRSRIFYKRG